MARKLTALLVATTALAAELPQPPTLSSSNGLLEATLNVVVSRLGGPIAFNRQPPLPTDAAWPQ